MKGWRFVRNLLACIAAVLLISFIGATTAGTRCYDPGLMASWLQAIGSIAAILGAVWIGERQLSAARAHADMQDSIQMERKWQGALAIVSAVEETANRVAVDLNFDEPTTYDPEWFFAEQFRDIDYHDLDRALEVIPLHDLPYAMAAQRFISLRRNFKRLWQKLQGVLDDKASAPGIDPSFKAAFFADEYVAALEIAENIRSDAEGIRQRFKEANRS